MRPVGSTAAPSAAAISCAPRHTPASAGRGRFAQRWPRSVGQVGALVADPDGAAQDHQQVGIVHGVRVNAVDAGVDIVDPVAGLSQHRSKDAGSSNRRCRITRTVGVADMAYWCSFVEGRTQSVYTSQL